MPTSEKPKILLIEDDPDQRLMYGVKFESEGYTFITANNGPKGLTLAKQEQPDLILLDIVMDEMDGLEVLKRLKSDPATKDVKVLLLSNLVVEEKIDEGKKLGALDFIVKSQVLPSDLVKIVKGYIK